MKRIFSLILALTLLPLSSWAADDAPVQLQSGDPAPVAGVLLPDALAVRRARELAALRVENEELKKAPAPLPPLAVVGLVLLGVLAGGAAGYGVAKATEKK